MSSEAYSASEVAAVPLGFGEETGGYRAWCQMREQWVSHWYASILPDSTVKFSVLVPVYKPKPRWITECIRSVRAQCYANWEMILVDDASNDVEVSANLATASEQDNRIVSSSNKTSRGISITTNHAAKLAKGEYLVFLDHDDLLDPYALLAFAQAIEKKPETDILYADEDRFDDNYQRIHPGFKPDFSPEKLLATNYIHHPVVIRRTLYKQLRGLRSEFDGSQDYDLLLRASDITQRIIHIPDVLYHMRIHEGSLSSSAAAKPLAHERGRKAVNQCLIRNNIRANIIAATEVAGYHYVERQLEAAPSVAVLVIADEEEEIADLTALQQLWGEHVKVLGCANVALSLAARLNALANQAIEDILVFTSIKVKPEENWQQHILPQVMRSKIGLVSGKIVYPDGLLFSCGWVLGIRACAGHWHADCNASDPGYGGWMNLTHEVSAVPWQLMAVRRDLFLSQGLFNTDFLYQGVDIDFSLRLSSQLGLRHLVVPAAKFNFPRTVEPTNDRLWCEQDFAKFWELWGKVLTKGDPYFNPQLSILNEGISFLGIDEMDLRERGVFSFYDSTTRELLRKVFPI